MTSVIKAATTRIYGTASSPAIVTGKVAVTVPTTYRKRSVFVGFYADHLVSIASAYGLRQSVFRLYADDELVGSFSWTWGGAENTSPGLAYINLNDPTGVGNALLVPSFTIERKAPSSLGEAPTANLGAAGEMIVSSLNEGDESRTLLRMQPIEIWSDAKEIRLEIETNGGTTSDFLFVALGVLAHPF